MPFIFYDKSKFGESQRRKAKGPVKWQPATERKVSYLKKSDYKILILIVESLSNDKGKPVEK